MRKVLFPCTMEPGTETEFGKKLVARVSKGMLTVTENGQTIFQATAEGEYVVNQTKGKTEVTNLNAPRGKGAGFISWICGAPYNDAGVKTPKGYKNKVERYKKSHKGEKTWECKGEGYMFCWTCNQNKDYPPYCVAFFIDKTKITKENILNLLPMMIAAGYTVSYIKKQLMKRYPNLTEQQFDKAVKDLEGKQ